MNKNKIYYLLLGIGLGVLITSSMNIAFNKTEKIEYTEEEIKEKAKNLGMISIKDNIEKNEEDEKEMEKTEETIAKEKLDKENAQREQAEKEKLDKEKAEAEQKALEDNKALEEKEQASAKISVTPEDGASSVIEKLKSNEVIDNQQEFKDLVVRHNLQKKFRTGEYEIQKDLSYEEILKIMIGQEELKDSGLL